MSGKKTPTEAPAAARAAQAPEEGTRPLGADRGHNQGLGRQWAVLVGNPEALMPQIVGTVLQGGATRAQWQVTAKGQEYALMAWPQDEPLRAAVVMRGPEGGDLRPAVATPLLDGAPNDFTVDEVYPFDSGAEANVGVEVVEGGKPLWFYTPLYFRDREDLTPGVTHTFVLAGLALGLRRALLDEITITQGPDYEAHAALWLEHNPGKSRLDVPPLKISVKGQKIIMPGRCFAEYELRNSISRVETTHLDKTECYILHMFFPFGKGGAPERAAVDALGGGEQVRPPIYLVVYVPKHLCGEYEPKVGDEVDAYVWLQGRILDVPIEQQEVRQEARQEEQAPAAPEAPKPPRAPRARATATAKKTSKKS